MRCIIYSPYWLRTILLFVVKSAFYILTLAWGFRRCSFRLVGQCESLYSVERVTEQAPRFFVCILVGEFRQQGSRLTIKKIAIDVNIIEDNPYRLLGVYANSSIKERLANFNRMKAFLKVGKSVSFPLDFPQFLSPANRSEESLAAAVAKLTLPRDQLLYAQFWFVKVAPIDEVAFKHMAAGDLSSAEKIWLRKEDAFSLQNRIVCALMMEEYSTALSCAKALYNNVSYVRQLKTEIAGENGNIKVEDMPRFFLDALSGEVGSNTLLPYITSVEWRKHIENKVIKPLIESIGNAISEAQKSKGKGSQARYAAGMKLCKETKGALEQLKKMLATSNLQYQLIADKLGLEILQCGIDYYNGSDEPDAALKAMKLQGYANNIVIGAMAKGRCQKNVEILQAVVDNLPPQEVYAEVVEINKLIKNFCANSYHSKGCKSILHECEPYLISMKEKVGARNEHYIRISTLLANVLLNFVIERCNEIDNATIHNELVDTIKLMWALRFGWNIILNIEKLDTSKEFRRDRLMTNKNIIKDNIDHLDPPSHIYLAMDAIGNLSRNFLKEYHEYWNLRYYDYSSRFGHLYSRGCGISIPQPPPTRGFMKGWEEEGFIDLRTEEDYFEECKRAFEKKNCSFACRAYIKKFPKGRFVEKVKRFQEVEQQEHKLYQEVSPTIEGYREYIEEHANGWHVKDAKKRIAELEREYQEFKREKRKHALMWALGITIPTITLSLFAILNWSVIVAVIVAFLVTCTVLGNIVDGKR